MESVCREVRECFLWWFIVEMSDVIWHHSMSWRMSFATSMKSTCGILGLYPFPVLKVLKNPQTTTCCHMFSNKHFCRLLLVMSFFLKKSLRAPVFPLQMSHAATSALCRSIKLQCELYPSRQIAICLDPYCGLGFALWCLCRYVVEPWPFSSVPSLLLMQGNSRVWNCWRNPNSPFYTDFVKYFCGNEIH